MTASVTMQAPLNITSIVMSTGTITMNTAAGLTGQFPLSEANAASLFANMPRIADSAGVASATNITWPGIFSALVLGTAAAITPDSPTGVGATSNTIKVPALDATKIVQTLMFSLIVATGTNPG